MRATFPPDDVPHSTGRARAPETRDDDRFVTPHRAASAHAPLDKVPVEMGSGPLLPVPGIRPALHGTRSKASTQSVRADAPPREDRRGAEPAPPRLGDVRNPPEPLLPPDAAHLGESLAAALVDSPAAARSAAHPAPEEPAAPEITIHIGRLDIRADPPRPAPRSRPAKARSLPSLSEYLRGGRS